MADERISTWGPDTMVRRRSRARPCGETLGLARTRILVSRTTLTGASCDAAEPASGLPEGRLPSLGWSCPGQPARPCSPDVSQGSRRLAGVDVQAPARRHEQDSARPAYGRRVPELQARLHFAPTDQSSGDRKSTRLNSSHLGISYAVFCLKK